MSLVLFLITSFSAAVLGGLNPPDAWFDSLTKPSWNPPGWVFGPVWTLLYAMIGTSGWLVWRDHGAEAIRWALALWLVQLILNATWSPAYIGWHRPDVSLLIIVGMWLTIASTIVAFWPLQRAAALLLVPYLAWVTFATALNASIWRLNAG